LALSLQRRIFSLDRELYLSLDVFIGATDNQPRLYEMEMSMTHTILIADDDPHIREVLQFALEKAGYRVDIAMNGKHALEKAATQTFSCIVLDITMPEMDGLEVCRQLRKQSEVPILFLSSRDEEIDRIVGLEIGGDDYVSKPFSPRELVARIKAILKRTSQPLNPTTMPKSLHKGLLSLDQNRYTALWNGKSITLTATEFMLLATFLGHPEKVFTRDQLMDGAYDNIIVSDRTIDSHIRRIRQKLADAGGQSVIETVHGIGYTLGTCQ
jgi:two-component system OmpR family response regulator